MVVRLFINDTIGKGFSDTQVPLSLLLHKTTAYIRSLVCLLSCRQFNQNIQHRESEIHEQKKN